MSRRDVWRVGAVAVAAVVVAEGAAWLLRPKEETVEPATVVEGDYFSSEQLERARDYRGEQRALLLATLALQGGVLAAATLGRPRVARRALDRLAGRPFLGGAAAGAGLAVALSGAALPLQLVAHEHAVDFGISTQELDSWFADQGKEAAIAVAVAAPAGALLLLLIRRFPRGWWMPAAGVLVAFEVAFVWLAPVILAPLFNRFEPLPEGRARADVIELADRAGVEIGEVYKVDASRRVTSLNAYVNGIGPTKRVVLYDNLLARVERPALRAVVAHELAHVEHSDVPRGLAWVALVSPLAMLFVRELGERLALGTGAEPGTPSSLPAVALAFAVAALGLSVVGNSLSREVEASADTRALELTRDPAALIDLQRRLALANLSDPDPPAWVKTLLATHPPATERIGAAVAWQRGERP